MSDTQNDSDSLTKPLKTLPLDSTIPSGAAKTESSSGNGDTNPIIQKGLDRARELTSQPKLPTEQPATRQPPSTASKPPQPTTSKPSTSDRPSTSKPDSSEDRDGELSFASGVNRFEGGSATAYNPNTGAAGWHQFEPRTWLDTIRKYRPDLVEGKTVDQVLALRGNYDISQEMTIDYAKENAQVLRASGIQPTGGNLTLAHFLGAKGAVNVLTAPGSDPIAMHVGPGVIENNPWLKGMTIDQAQKAMEIKANGGRLTSTGGGTDNPATRGREITSDPQYREIAKRLLELHPGAPGLTFSNGRGQVEKQPSDNPWVEAFTEFAQYAAAILAATAVSGSKRGRITSIGAMGALANAINGVTEGNQQKYKNNILKFEAQTQRMAEQNKAEAEQYKLILEKYKYDQGALLGALRAKSLELQDEKLQYSIEHGDATLAEVVAQHRAEIQHWADQVAAKAEPVLTNPDQDIYFNWMKEFEEQNGRKPNTQERLAFQQQQLREKKEAATKPPTLRDEFVSNWHKEFVEKQGREPTSEEWAQAEQKWKQASTVARSLSPAQQEQQRQITAAQNALQSLTDGKEITLPGGQKITPQEWIDFLNKVDPTQLTEKEKDVLIPLNRLAHKRLDDDSETPQNKPPDAKSNGNQWTPPAGSMKGTPEQFSRFKDGDLAESKGKFYRVDKEHGYFIPEEPTQNPSPG